MPPTFTIHDFGPDRKVQCWNFTIHDFGMDRRIQLVYIFNPFQPQPCNLILNPSIMRVTRAADAIAFCGNWARFLISEQEFQAALAVKRFVGGILFYGLFRCALGCSPIELQ